VIVFSIQIVAPDDKRATIVRALSALLGPTGAAAGCMQTHLYGDIDKPRTLFFVEEWESRAQFERNLDTTKINTIVAVIELCDEAPVVRVDSVEREEGVDTLALHRKPTGIARH
jgi:quinol monooxygenase YgiN